MHAKPTGYVAKEGGVITYLVQSMTSRQSGHRTWNLIIYCTAFSGSCSSAVFFFFFFYVIIVIATIQSRMIITDTLTR
jgi:hypothetical protein